MSLVLEIGSAAHEGPPGVHPYATTIPMQPAEGMARMLWMIIPEAASEAGSQRLQERQ
ncbi:hypothetical protein [Phreatobacter oligotrophus]|uniref:hypothetical protein n=1 Tax=Phreatobacter oligotrophus TaxID=1122261 RepID=UPI0014735FE7|nr:hypothetical protein [Phreatobacter oligotrophus]